MTLNLGPTLNAEMGSLVRHHGSQATSELWLPRWTPIVSGLSGNKYEQYAHGHAACVGFGADNGYDVLCRARSGSYANPFDGILYVAVIKGADLSDPSTWESKWVSTGQGALMRPAWYNNTETTPASNGGSVAIAWSGTFFRVFFTHTNGNLYYLDVDTDGTIVTNTTLVASLGTDTYQISSMQIASCNHTEVFVLKTELVEASLDAWQKPVYGSSIHRISGNGTSWSDWPTFPFHTHAEAALLRDSQFDYGSAGSEWGSGSAGDIIAQWGKRPCGGLGANEIDSNTVVVSAGFTFWKRYGYNTHNQGILTFIYHRDSGQWERGVEADVTDYVDDRLDYALFARGSRVQSGSEVLVWSRDCEPSDYDQLEASLTLPRAREVVYAKFSPDGKALTQYQYLGPQDDLTSAAILLLTSSSGANLYAIGWRSIYQSEPASFLGDVTSVDVLDTLCDGWKTNVNNRFGMNVNLNLEDASTLFQPDSVLQPGRLVRIYAGTPTDQVQIAQGLVDTITPDFNLAQELHRARVVARAEKGLLDPRSEDLSEIMPQNTIYIPPTDPIAHIANHQGYWETVAMEWPSKFGELSGVYNGLNGRAAYRLKSFPYAYTGGDQGYGYPGMVLDARPQYKGTWFNDAAWTDLSPMVDGSVEATVRFGDVNAGSNFNFWARDGAHVYATVSRSGTLISQIQWRTNSYSGSVWNYVNQSACMAGLICHAAEMNKKFAFIWEANTSSNAVYSSIDKVPSSWYGRAKPFSASSHTDDTWRAETMDRCDYYPYGLGWNMLYLVESDYDDTDPDWQKNSKWIHKVVAGGVAGSGLTPGYPADLKMVVLGGTIYCFYRPHQQDGQAPSLWTPAFSYKAGRFGAGRFGIVGRGHAGIQWDALYYAKAGSTNVTGRDKIPLYDNYVDFWDIKASDCVIDRPMEEILRRRCWQGFTPTVFSPIVNESPAALTSGQVKAYANLPVENMTLDFKVSSSALATESGVILRAVNPTSPASQSHYRLGIVVNGSSSYAILRAYNSSGVEVASDRQYSPFPLYLHNTWKIPVRITSRGPVYSLWVAGNYAGHFWDDTPGGVYFGLYSLNGTSTFTNVYVPELYEVLEASTLEVNQTVYDAIKNMLGKRAVKGVYQPYGQLKLSYFENHDTGPTLQDSLTASTPRLSDRFYSVVRVDGAYTWAVYPSEVMMQQGRRFKQESYPDIFHREFCYREARNQCLRAAEDQVQTTFTGLPDYRIQPEDKVEIFVTPQNIAGHYLVDDITHSFEMGGEEPSADSEIATRMYVVI